MIGPGNNTDYQASLGFIPADEIITITGAGLLASQGGDLSANRVFTLNNGDIDHDALFNYELLEHIDWTETSSNLKTVGTGQFKNLGIDTGPDAEIGIKLFREIGGGTYGQNIKSTLILSGRDTEGIGLWNLLSYPYNAKEDGLLIGVKNQISANQDGVTVIGMDNAIDNGSVDGITYGLRQIFGSGSDGSFLAPIYQEFDAQGSGQTINGVHNVGNSGNESHVRGMVNDFTVDAYGGSGTGIKNTISLRNEDDNGWGVWNHIYGHATSSDYIELYGTYNLIVPNQTDMNAYGTYTTTYPNPFSKPTINNPSAFQAGIYLDWYIDGTDTNNKKWAFYNAGTLAVSSKIFLGKDAVATYFGTGYDASILYDGSDFIFDSQKVGSGDFKMNGGYFYINVRSGATQGGAGASAGEIWKTYSHATLPDNVLMIGV